MDINIESIVREYINKSAHMSLATTNGLTPWICEVHFAYDENLHLYFRSMSSRRHSQEIAANPSVAGNIIDKYAVGEPVVGIYYEGEAQQVTSTKEQELAAKHLKSRLSIASNIIEEASRDDGFQIYKITVKNWYVFGKFGDSPFPQKYELQWGK